MRKSIMLFCVFTFILSCGKNDDNAPSLEGACQLIFDTGPPGVFYINLVDINGNNLIENGFFDPDIITAKLNGTPLDSDITPSESPELNNLAILGAIGNDGDNTWLLTLSETDVDTLNFSMTLVSSKFIYEGKIACADRFELNAANYNGMNIEWDKTTSDSSLIIPVLVVKSVD